MSACNVSKAKFEELGDERRTLTYACDPYEAAQNLQQRVKWMEESKILYGPFNPSGKAFNDVPKGAPTISAEKETLDILRMIFKEDWPDAEVGIDVNAETKEWVVKAKIDDGRFSINKIIKTVNSRVFVIYQRFTSLIHRFCLTSFV